MSLHREGDSVWLQVKDDGIGIAPQDLEKIWNRFYQVDPSRSGDSSGLGLSMVKWIAEAHGGRVQVNSTLGQGSCFTVKLPFTGPKPGEGS